YLIVYCSWFSVVFFFFSSRRRHTRFSRDWSSDVCSSDLAEVGEAEIDGDAAAPLLGKAVGVDAGERSNERGLAVVDVTGRAEDEVGHQRLSSASTRNGSERSVAPSATWRVMKRCSSAQWAAGRSISTALPCVRQASTRRAAAGTTRPEPRTGPGRAH